MRPKPLVRITAVYSFQCFDTDGWVTGSISTRKKTVLLISRNSFPEKVFQNDPKKETAKQGY